MTGQTSVGVMRCRACGRDAESVVRRDEAHCVGCNGSLGEYTVNLALCDACQQPHAYWCVRCAVSPDWRAGMAAGQWSQITDDASLDWLAGYEAGMRTVAR